MDKAYNYGEKEQSSEGIFFEAGKNPSLIFCGYYSIHPVLFKSLLWAKLLLCGGDLNF